MGYCINKHGESQLYWFDDRHLPDGARRVDVVCQHHWGVTVSGVHVGKHNIQMSTPESKETPSPQLCGDEPCVAIMDTGTNFIVGPAPIINQVTKHIVRSGFREDCLFQEQLLPDIKFTLGNETFFLKPSHYIVRQKVKTPAGVEVEACALLFGGMDMMDTGSEEQKESAAKEDPDKKQKHGSMENIFILGTPFMRSNYIRFAHPIGGDPHIMIHEKCPEDFSKKEKRRIQKAQSAMQQQQQAHHFIEVAPDGSTIDRGESQPMNTQILRTGKGDLQRPPTSLMQLSGKGDFRKPWLTKNWHTLLATGSGGRECTPGQKMHFRRDEAPATVKSGAEAKAGVALAALLAVVAGSSL